MSANRTYLDHNATSPIRPEVRDVMIEAMDVMGNPSSVHSEGRVARGLIDDAREKVAALAGARADEVIFTSGGSEANNQVVHQAWGSVIMLATEHDSIMNTARAARAQTAILPVDRDGRADLKVLDSLMAALATRDGNMLISIQMANNETGVLQDLGGIRERITAFIEANDPREDDGSKKEIIFHTDAVQALAKIPVDFVALGVDAMSLSAHKIGGPKGVGALIKRKGVSLASLIKGGGQEFSGRAGTENVLGIIGFGKAAELALADLKAQDEVEKLRNHMEDEIAKLATDAKFMGRDADRLPNTSSIAFPGVQAERAIIAFDLQGIAISAGAACSSGKVGRSRVLEAMQVHDNIADATIRVSFGWNTTDSDVDKFLAAVPNVIAKRQEANAA